MKITYQNSESYSPKGIETCDEDGKPMVFTVTRRTLEDERKDSAALKRESTGKICVSFGHSDWMKNGKVWTGNLIEHCAPRVSPAGYVMVKCQKRYWYAVPTEVHFTARDGKTYIYNSWHAEFAHD